MMFKLMSTIPSQHAPPPSLNPHSDHAATPEERRGGCMECTVNRLKNDITLAVHIILKASAQYAIPLCEISKLRTISVEEWHIPEKQQVSKCTTDCKNGL